MKLYHSATSPYVRKVMVVAHLTGQLDRLELVPGSGTPLEPNQATAAANPLAKVPCLVTDEGASLYDSRVITRYLDARAGAGLYPEGEALWPVLVREALADGILDAAVLAVYEGRLRPEERRYAPFVEAQRHKIRRALDQLEREAPTFGEWPDAGLIAAACAVAYVDFRHTDIAWRGERPHLTAWYETVSAREEMTTTAPPGE